MHHSLLAITIAFSIPVAAFGAAKKTAPPQYIVGGQDVAPNDIINKITVGIFGPSGDGHSGSLCTGTLIRKDVAVTAAHCIPPGGQKPVVIFGKDLHAPDAIKRPAQAVAVNPKWETQAGRGMDQGDIALVKFPGGLPSGYQKAPTIKTESEIKNGDTVTLAGFGINDARAKTGAGILRKTDVSVLNSRPRKSEMILDQSRGHGACHGDSGGPAFINRGGKTILAGVTNRGYPNTAPDDCGHQVVYTKVPAYKNWIQKTEKQMDQGEASPRVLLGKNESSRKATPLSTRIKKGLGRPERNHKIVKDPSMSRSPHLSKIATDTSEKRSKQVPSSNSKKAQSGDSTKARKQVSQSKSTTHKLASGSRSKKSTVHETKRRIVSSRRSKKYARF